MLKKTKKKQRTLFKNLPKIRIPKKNLHRMQRHTCISDISVWLHSTVSPNATSNSVTSHQSRVASDGELVGPNDGCVLGATVGVRIGTGEGECVGSGDGTLVGLNVGS